MSARASSSSQAVSSNEGVAADELRQFIERIERLEEEKAGIAADIKDVFAELKGRGFDVKAVRSILRIRKKDHSERQEEEAILELYMQALGMLADTPLGRAAASREFGETKITISAPGLDPVETTGAGLQRAAASAELQNHTVSAGRKKPRAKSFVQAVGDRLEEAFADRPDVEVRRNVSIGSVRSGASASDNR